MQIVATWRMLSCLNLNIKWTQIIVTAGEGNERPAMCSRRDRLPCPGFYHIELTCPAISTTRAAGSNGTAATTWAAATATLSAAPSSGKPCFIRRVIRGKYSAVGLADRDCCKILI